MEKVVIKKDGTKEPFDITKLKHSIRVNALDAVMEESEENINNLVEKISGKVVELIRHKKEISSEELRENILSELDSIAPTVARIWRKYDEEMGKG